MNKPKLIAPSACPYGGTYALNSPEIGMVGKGSTFEQLMGQLSEWRRANAWPIGLGFRDEAEREICLRYPQECRENDPRVPDTSLRLTLDDILQGTRNLLAFKLAGSPLVSDAEAERRAKICSSCPFQSDHTRPCSTCNAVQELVLGLIGPRKTPYDNRLQSCRVCRCANIAKVWVPTEFQTKHLTDQQRASFEYARELHGCWTLD